jgi:arylsulfatase A-like enzyme
LPIPHPPGLYNRQTQKLQTHGSYIDNLALTDDVLAKALAAIRATPSADQTTVVISSDHSWRIPMWKDSFLWTKEDANAYRDTFDQRPVLMIRFPGELQPESVDEQFPGLKLHALLEAMLYGSLNSPDDLKLWLSLQKKSGSE